VTTTASDPERRALPRGLVILLSLAAVTIVVAGMRGASSLIGPALLALVLTIAAHPLRRWLDRAMPSWLASLVCILVVYVLVVGLAFSVVVSTARFASLLGDYEDEFNKWVTDFADKLHDWGVSASQLHALTSSLDLAKLAEFLTSILSGALGVVSNLVFILTLVLFMTVDASQFPRILRNARGTRPDLVAALDSYAASTRSYLIVSTAFGLIVAVIDTVALAILDVPAPLVWGLLAFLTNYIPNIGFIVGLVPPAILALLDGGLGKMIWVIVVYSLINVVIQSVIQPKVVGDTVGLSTTLTFLSLVFWSWVLGPLGAILAIPLSLLVKAVLVDADPGSRWLDPLVANNDHGPAAEAAEPGLSPPGS
jgi:AI-2 transport protein TqsA